MMESSRFILVTLAFAIVFSTSTGASAAAETAYDLRESMVGWYEFENESLFDSIRNVSANVSDNANYTFVDGINGRAIRKEGGTINVSLGNKGVNDAYSFTVWVKQEPTDTNEYNLFQNLQIWNSRLQTFIGAWTPILVNGSTVSATYLRSGEWVFIAFSNQQYATQGNGAFFIDGVKSSNFDGSNTISSPAINLNTIGYQSKGKSVWDQLVVYNRALTDEEILLVYNDGLGTDFANPDSGPPVVENASVPVSVVSDDDGVFMVQASDDVGVSSVTLSFRNPNRETIGPLEMTLDNGSWVYSYRFTLVGDYDSVVFNASDDAGNTATLNGEPFFINNAPTTSGGGGGGGGATAPSLADSVTASATIVADPDDWVRSSFNQKGKFIITNTGERRHTFTILASSPTLTDRVSMGGEPIVTIPIDGTDGPSRNAQWVEYSVIGQDLPVGEHEVTFTVVSSQGVVLSTEEVTVRISNSGSESLMSFFSTPVFSVFSSDDPTVKTASFSVGQLVLMGLGVLAFGLFLRRLGGVSL